jgi:hypothetical protein
MAIDTTCPSCYRALSVDDSFAGRQARCPMCEHVYTVTIQDSTLRRESPENSYSPNISALSPLNDSWDKFDPRQETAPHPGLQRWSSPRAIARQQREALLHQGARWSSLWAVQCSDTKGMGISRTVESHLRCSSFKHRCLDLVFRVADPTERASRHSNFQYSNSEYLRRQLWRSIHADEPNTDQDFRTWGIDLLFGRCELVPMYFLHRSTHLRGSHDHHGYGRTQENQRGTIASRRKNLGSYRFMAFRCESCD